jgi:diaminopimelate epimerase
MRFTKMHGLSNDYVYVDCFRETVSEPVALARVISDRHRGAGGDGLILIGPSDSADVRMRIFNADGSEAEMCGNGIRCVAKYVYDHKLAEAGGPYSVPGQPPYPASLNIETGNGILTVGLDVGEDGTVGKVCVNMGRPVLKPEKIPVNLPGERVVNSEIDILGKKLLMTCVSMGNPHAVFFCDDVDAVELARLGPVIENHALFGNRTNAHFVQVQGRGRFEMRTWERGSGITMACGTGACACCVAAVLTGVCDRICIARLPGGELELNWSAEDDCVYMTGPATEVFEGVWPD